MYEIREIETDYEPSAEVWDVELNKFVFGWIVTSDEKLDALRAYVARANEAGLEVSYREWAEIVKSMNAEAEAANRAESNLLLEITASDALVAALRLAHKSDTTSAETWATISIAASLARIADARDGGDNAAN